MILAGDIGGTNTRLAWVAPGGERLTVVQETTFPSREYASLEAVLERFFSAQRFPVERACFGVAGPVRHGRVDTTNLPWVVDSRSLAGQLGLEHVGLINDLVANAHGIAALEAKDFTLLNPGAADAQGNVAIISAGTGLGEAGLYWDGTRHRPFATEGGHATFAPRGALEMDLLRHASTQFQHVSVERVLSGPGLLLIYRFLRDTGHGEEPAWLAEELRQRDPSAVIAETAMESKNDLCIQALDLFVSIYGAEAGNLALKVMATGGVFLGGGIAPKILPKLQDPVFLEAFGAKGRMMSLLLAMPVRVILNDKTALLGAARYAALSVTVDPTPAGTRGAMQ
ncbi:MAG TPA: glucokinase [Candidatus Methylomirabilis sp.]|nr:glucokinase [Candidatus Methylomirabilis sp.]